LACLREAVAAVARVVHHLPRAAANHLQAVVNHKEAAEEESESLGLDL